MLTFLYSTWDPSTGISLGPVTLHYYSLMFIFAFGLGYYLMTKIYKIDNVNLKYVEPLFTWTLVGTILGVFVIPILFIIFQSLQERISGKPFEEKEVEVPLLEEENEK